MDALDGRTQEEQGAALLEAAQARQAAAIEFLRALVEIETPSDVPDAQGPALDVLSDAFRDLGMSVRRFQGRTSGGTIIARWPNPDGKPRQLLVGHCDTVWPIGTLETMPLEQDGSKLAGPGTFDMKCGLTQGIFALRVLRDLDLEPDVAPVFLINSDEELGTYDTHATLQRIARIVDRVFVMEPSLAPDGRLKTARKGVAQYGLIVRGRAAHAGLNPEEGISAIDAMARLIPQLHALNDPASGVNVNVGTITGGTRPNVVAAECSIEIDVRVPTRADADRVEAAIFGLEPPAEGITLEPSLTEGRAPMEFTVGGQKLWAAASRIADSIGLDLDHGQAGGGSDGNITAEFAPTLDGLGPVGDGAHSAHEHVDLDAMPERVALVAGLLLEPPLGPQGEEA